VNRVVNPSNWNPQIIFGEERSKNGVRGCRRRGAERNLNGTVMNASRDLKIPLKKGGCKAAGGGTTKTKDSWEKAGVLPGKEAWGFEALGLVKLHGKISD